MASHGPWTPCEGTEIPSEWNSESVRIATDSDLVTGLDSCSVDSDWAWFGLVE